MRKIVLGLLAATAVGAPIAMAASSANAAVTYDDKSVGTVDKGDVQTLFGLNDNALQNAVKDGKITFTSKYQMDNNANAWTCSDGSTQKWTLRTVQSRALNVTTIVNKSANKVTGFTLSGIDETKGGTFFSGERIGSLFTCPAGSSPTSYYVPQTPAEQFVNTVLPGVQVTYNGTTYDLPNTPAPVPVP
ncbi:hypothetical protein EV644_10457 [Kribbella orskensis]|uniref:Uncharacterized protein n=1 Tax=Kribbella orskensis TaxID=2512216 RepID=A0ABY2BMS1_9ACTN|nr:MULTISPECIES: hypothetical protein [Kribbella]TCN41675.1 hypothetical protein EV642_10357 [Kribbella sp. VKM Ac-2500]TCO25553.1 hypothetical protein EV644_10457 [Kribbella orskensis]